MKKMQKIISIILSAVLVLSLCIATPMTASAKQDSVSDALAAAADGTDIGDTAGIVKSMYNIVTILLTIDGLDIAQADMEVINQTLATVKPIIENPEATEQQLGTAAIALSNAFTVLSPYMEALPSDVIPPQSILVLCEAVRISLNSGIMQDNLTEDDIALLESAMEKAEAVASDPNATQEDIQNAYEELMETINSIGPSEPFDSEKARKELQSDLEYLTEQRDTFSFLLTETDLAQVNDALASLTEITAQVEITVADYNNAMELVVQLDAMLSFENKDLTKDDLKLLIDKAQEYLGSDLYTKESLDDLELALNDAQTVYNDDNADEEDIWGAFYALQEAINSLEKAEEPTEPTDPTEGTTAEPTDAPTDAPTVAPTNASTSAPTNAPTSAPTNTGSGKGDVTTGDNSWQVVATLSLLMLAAAAVVFVSRKKREAV